MSTATIATVRVPGLGYEPEYFVVDGHNIVHAAVSHVDARVRALAPVWLPHVAPTPLCGLGRSGRRRAVLRSSGTLCRACADHLRDLDEWVRHAEMALSAAELAVDGVTVNSPAGPTASRVHAMPF